MYERFSTLVRKLNQNFLSGDSFKYCNQMNIHTIMSQNQRTSTQQHLIYHALKQLLDLQLSKNKRLFDSEYLLSIVLENVPSYMYFYNTVQYYLLIYPTEIKHCLQILQHCNNTTTKRRIRSPDGQNILTCSQVCNSIAQSSCI